MLIWTGTAEVTNGDATVVVDTGAALTAEVVAYGAMVVLDGVVYFADSLTDTTTLEMTRVYAGSTGTVGMEIWPVSQDTTNLVNLAQIVARTQAQINILDKNSQGLFFMMKGVTGAADPGPGFIAFDDDDATLVTEAYIDALDANGRAVSELVGLWEAGTTIVVRSLSTTAYRAYAVATNTGESGWTTLALTYVGHDGVLADNEALGISWSRAATGLEIDATGNFTDRDSYDDEPAGFVFLSADGDGDTITVSCLFRKNSGTTADWGPAVPFQGAQGDKGWSPVFAVVNDTTRRVLRLVDYVGGDGTKPTTGINQYVSSGGLTGTIGSATDIRGPQGLSAYEVAVVNGFAGTQAEWLASLVGSIEGVTAFWQGRILVDENAAAARAGLEIAFASEEEAEAGSNSTKYMTPERVAQAIAALAPEPPSIEDLAAEILIDQRVLGLIQAKAAAQQIFLGGGGSALHDPFEPLDYVDVGGATGLDTSETQVLKPNITTDSDSSAAADGTIVGSFDGTTFTRAFALDNGKTVEKLGIYATTAATYHLKICKRNSSTSIDVVVSEAFAHAGSGWQDFTLSAPYVVPGSGTYHLGMYAPGISAVPANTSVARIGGFGVGVNQGVATGVTTSESTGATTVMRAIYSTDVDDLTVFSLPVESVGVPSTISLLAFVSGDEVLNSDAIFSVSRNEGVDLATATMTELFQQPGGIRVVYSGPVDVGSQPAGTSVFWQLNTSNSAQVEVHGIVIWGDA